MPRPSKSTLAAIKHAVDIVALVGEYLPLHRSGSKFKALCPFHDDHNPSLELNPDRQSYKCWSCGAGGDVFDFVMEYERIEFPEALRMLADRAGVALDAPSAAPASGGPSKTDLLAVIAWAEAAVRRGAVAVRARRGLRRPRGICRESVGAVPAGLRPGRARLADLAGEEGRVPGRPAGEGRAGHPAGRVAGAGPGAVPGPPDVPDPRPQGAGDRLRRSGPAGRRNVARRVGQECRQISQQPRDAPLQERQVLYAGDLARAAAREAGWVAVVEGYTDVIAAHQVGLCNVVGPWARPWATTTSSPSGGWPTGSS